LNDFFALHAQKESATIGMKGHSYSVLHGPGLGKQNAGVSHSGLKGSISPPQRTSFSWQTRKELEKSL